MSERVRAARAAGKEIISLSSGDPGLPTDQRIIEAAERALAEGKTHYSAVAGEPGFRNAIVKREAERAGAVYDPADVVVTPGGKFAVLTALMGVVEPGDEVLIPAPGWVSYGPCTRLAGGTPVALPMLDVLDLEEFERLVTERTRAVILNSPSNPTGRVMDGQEMAILVDLAVRHNLWIIFDQVYSDLVYDGAATFPQSSEAGFERTLVVDSLSKSFCMTGWRLGYLATPGNVVRSFTKFVQHSVYCVPAFIQAAGERALELSGDILPGYRALFKQRMRHATEILQAIDGVDCQMPPASLHLFPSVVGDETAIARRWLEECHVSVLPGTAFGPAGAGHLRVSVTCKEEELDLALQRIAKAGI